MADIARATETITQGALRGIFNESPGGVAEPVLQCVQIKAMERKDNSQPDRYRVVLSDVQNFIQSMLATQCNHYIIDDKLKKGSLVRIKQYTPNIVKGKKILIILDLDVLSEYGECEKIGQPAALETVRTEDTMKMEETPEPQPAGIASNGFYGNKPPAQAQQQQAQALPSRPNNSNNSHSRNINISPISELSPYTHKWTIKARCTHKSDIKTWHKQSGEGKLFSVNLLDDTDEIRATGFNAECDALYDVFHEGGVYLIHSPCRVQLANKKFTQVKHDYELTFERDTQVEKAEDDDRAIPQLRYNFTSIGSLQSIEKDSMIDCIGILKEVGEVSQITSKTTSKPYDKRELTLVDDSQYSVRLTIWGNSAQSFDAPVESVVAFKGVKVSDFGGRSLSLLSSGSMLVDPDIDEAHKLKGWYDAQGRNDAFAGQANDGTMSTTSRKDDTKIIAQIREENLGVSEKPDYFSVKATIVYIKNDNVAYPACMSEGCNKKVVEMDPGQWRCEKCEKSWPKPLYRYIMSVNVEDHTGQLWLNIFDDIGRIIMGMSADELMDIKENDDQKAKDAFAEANCKTYVFRCRAKMDTFQDQQRVRYHAMSAASLNFSNECAKLVDILKQYDMNSDSLFVN
ncbi:replication factor A 1, rfa1 [Rhizodiscina lignyota]|uniref:Replication protein A subunit n=1 Tax=Rhizodiscina lignyota TaxID=1504668 RepID=A0A9P4M8E5_9PEZI|nr:replication factor A 1, rfa1 [Rhizodiscina lignyota]